MRGRTMYRRAVRDGSDRFQVRTLRRAGHRLPTSSSAPGPSARMGDEALAKIPDTDSWVRRGRIRSAPRSATHEQDVPWPSNDTKYITHFPRTREIWSFGSAYGGNAVLAKKAFALRIASTIAREEAGSPSTCSSLKVTNPRGKVFHLAAAFPSACRARPTSRCSQPTIPGWKVETMGDDIAWLTRGDDGRLRAHQPGGRLLQRGRGTGPKTNPGRDGNPLRATRSSRTSRSGMTATCGGRRMTEEVARPPDRLEGQGLDSEVRAARQRIRIPVLRCNRPVPVHLGRLGRPARASSSTRSSSAAVGPATCHSWWKHEDWEHGVYLGATVSSEQTTAAEGTVGGLRRDPFAMLLFCGYQHRRPPGSTGCRWAAPSVRAASCRRGCSRRTGSARTPTAASCGRASARTPAHAGVDAGARRRAGRRRRQPDRAAPRRPRTSTWTASRWTSAPCSTSTRWPGRSRPTRWTRSSRAWATRCPRRCTASSPHLRTKPDAAPARVLASGRAARAPWIAIVAIIAIVRGIRVEYFDAIVDQHDGAGAPRRCARRPAHPGAASAALGGDHRRQSRSASCWPWRRAAGIVMAVAVIVVVSSRSAIAWP